MEINSDEFYKKIGNRIRNARLEHNFSREYLAELADISPKHLYEIERGNKGCSSYVLYRLVEALELKCDFVMYGETSMLSNEELEEIVNMFSYTQMGVVRDILKMLYKFIKI